MGWKESKRAQGFKDMLVWLEPTAVEALEQLKAGSPGASVADLISKAVILAAGAKLPDTAGHGAGEPGPDVAGIKDRLAAVELRVAGIEGEVQRLAQSSQSSVTRDDFFSLVESHATLADKIDLLEAQPASTTSSAIVITTPEEPAHPEPDLEAEAPQAVESSHQDQEGGADAEPTEPQRLNGSSRVDPAPLLEAVADKVEEAGSWEWNITSLYRELEAKGVKVQGLPRNFCTWVKKHHAAVEVILDQRRADRGES